MFPSSGGLSTALRARGGMWLLAVLSVAISQIGLQCHGHTDSHLAETGAVALASMAEAAHGNDEQPPSCRQHVSPVVFPTLKRTTDAWWRMTPALSAALLAVEGSGWGKLDLATVRRFVHGVLQRAIAPAGAGLLVLIGVLRA